MKNLNSPPALFLILAVSFALSSCSAIVGIFKAGMGVGIFLVVFLIIVIAIIVMRAGKK